MFTRSFHIRHQNRYRWWADQLPRCRLAPLLAAAVLLTGAANGHANQAIELFSQVATNTPAIDESGCSYTTTTTSGDGVFVERFTARESTWQLSKVNGEDPDTRAMDDYADAAGQRKRRNHPLAFDLEKLAQMDTLRMTDEDADTATFTFALRPDGKQENQAFLDKMHGTLVIDKSGLRPLEFIIESSASFSPAPTFKIKEFRQEMLFRYDEVLSTSVVSEMKSHFLAKVFIFKTIEDDRVVTFSDYTCN